MRFEGETSFDDAPPVETVDQLPISNGLIFDSIETTKRDFFNSLNSSLFGDLTVSSQDDLGFEAFDLLDLELREPDEPYLCDLRRLPQLPLDFSSSSLPRPPLKRTRYDEDDDGAERKAAGHGRFTTLRGYTLDPRMVQSLRSLDTEESRRSASLQESQMCKTLQAHRKALAKVLWNRGGRRRTNDTSVDPTNASFDDLHELAIIHAHLQLFEAKVLEDPRGQLACTRPLELAPCKERKNAEYACGYCNERKADGSLKTRRWDRLADHFKECDVLINDARAAQARLFGGK